MIKYKFTKTILIIDILLALYSLFTALFSVFKLAKLFGMQSFSLFIDILSILISVGILICIISQLLFSGYYFEEKQLKIRILFFSQKLSYENIVEIDENIDDKEMIMYHVKDKDAAQFAVLPINIDKAKNMEFVTFLRERNTAIVYSQFSKKDTGKKDDGAQ